MYLHNTTQGVSATTLAQINDHDYSSFEIYIYSVTYQIQHHHIYTYMCSTGINLYQLNNNDNTYFIHLNKGYNTT